MTFQALAVMIIGAMLLASCGPSDQEVGARYKAEHEAIREKLRPVLCGEGSISDRAMAVSLLVDHADRSDPETVAQQIVDAGGEIESETCGRPRPIDAQPDNGRR